MSHITINMQNGLKLELKPSQLRIELDNDSITVRATDNVTLFAGYNLPADTHGAYAEWAEWDGCRFATPSDRALFEKAVQSFVEKHAA